MALGQTATFLIQFLATVVLARYLTPRETGIYAVALSLVGIVSLIQALGLRAFVVREETLTQEIIATAFTINALISTALAAVIAGTSWLGAQFLGDVGVQKVMLVLALMPIFEVFAFLPAASLERHGRFKEIALVGTLATIATAIVSIVLVVIGFSYMSIAYAQWTQGLLSAIAMNIIGRRYASFRIGFSAWRRVADFGLQMLAVTGVSAISIRLSDVILGRFLGLSSLGIYSRASGLNALIWTNIHLVVGRVVFVDFADIHRQNLSLRNRYLQTVAVATSVLWPAFAGLAILSKPFIFIVYGERWVPAATPLIFLAISSMILVAITMTWELFAATGNLRSQTRIEFIRSLSSLLAFGIGCTISLTAAAAARVFDAIFAFILYRPHLDRMTGTKISDFAPIYGQSALLTVVAVAPATILMGSYRMAPQVPVIYLLGAVVAGIVLWCVGLVFLKHPIAE